MEFEEFLNGLMKDNPTITEAEAKVRFENDNKID